MYNLPIVWMYEVTGLQGIRRSRISRRTKPKHVRVSLVKIERFPVTDYDDPLK